MSDQDLIVETVRDILRTHGPFVLTPQRRFDAELWLDLAGAGLTGVGLPEEVGGSGGELADAVAVVATLAEGAAAVPAAEQLLVAGPALVRARLALPDPARVCTCFVGDGVTAALSGEQWQLRGTVAVPWAQVASHLVTLASAPDGPVLAAAAIGAARPTDNANLAGEPCGVITLDGTVCDAVPLSAQQADELRARFALARSVQIAAALQQVLAWTVQYADERQQFGQPLARFQAIQMELSEMAGEVTAAAALVDAAVQALGRGSDVVLAAAAAKLRAGAAVEVVARLAHQVHGAIGFTQEHKLHHLTRRLWSWRDEAGAELHWSQVLGAGLIAVNDDLWASLTRVL